ncbi:amphi-Trp domain-containing protein [Streptomyces sp. NPDC048560]|uniref:amphi-Trp domain-containing protein n=1 Tax=Streptomyces sp. NPDC048560 TaxID=3155488 RepID=UPI00342ADF47
MSDLKLEQKRSLSRQEAADQLTALADALREGGDVELELGAVSLSLRVPEDLHCEMEVEVGDGEIELEIEFKWPIAPTRSAPSRTAAGPEEAEKKKTVPARPARSGTGAGKAKSTKRPAPKAP